MRRRLILALSCLTLLCLALLLFVIASRVSYTPQSPQLTEAIEIPLISSATLRDQLLVRASVNNEEGLFIVDTGANVCVLSQQFAAEIGLELSPLSERRAGSNVNSGIRTAQVGNLRLGSADFNKFKVAVLDLSHINQFIDDPVDGIIGMSLLSLSPTLTIDSKKQLLTLNAQQFHGEIAPAILEENKLFTDMVVNGKSIRMKIDTGASSTSVDSETWQILKGSGTVRKEKSITADINGVSKKPIQVISIRTLALGDLSVRDLSIESEDDNLLGMNLLKRYVVTFSFNENRMYFQSNTANEPDEDNGE